MISCSCRRGFSLVEVVIALGVIAFALVAILGAFPIGLQTGHSAQDETRAVQIAQDIFAALSSQARSSPTPNLNSAATVNQWPTTISPPAVPPSPFTLLIDLTSDNSKSPYVLGADNDGNLQTSFSPDLPYLVTVAVVPITTTAFASGAASTVTIRVARKPFQTNYREFTRVVSKY